MFPTIPYRLFNGYINCSIVYETPKSSNFQTILVCVCWASPMRMMVKFVELMMVQWAANLGLFQWKISPVFLTNDKCCFVYYCAPSFSCPRRHLGTSTQLAGLWKKEKCPNSSLVCISPAASLLRKRMNVNEFEFRFEGMLNNLSWILGWHFMESIVRYSGSRKI